MAGAEHPTHGALRAFHEVEAGLARLRELTDPAAVLAAAPAQLGPGSGLARVLVHTVHDGVMTAEAAWVDGDRAAAGTLLASLRAHPTRLTPQLAETDLVRRRRTILVRDAAAAAEPSALAAAMRWRGYVAAPLLYRSLVVGVLHGDRGSRARADPADRELASYFADAASLAYERARLRRALREERSRLRAMLAWLDERSRELANVAVELAGDDGPTVEALSGLSAAPAPGPVDTLVFDGVLTRRELEVLRLISHGRANREIAGELVISLGTAKFHVNRILRKLGVGNRAQAAARYHTLVERGTS